MNSIFSPAWMATLVVLLAGNTVIHGQHPRIYRDRVVAHWLPGSERFWYRVSLPDHGGEFVLVDAVRGERRPAFDHQAVATELSKQRGAFVATHQLPFRGMRFAADGKSLELVGPEIRCRLSLDDGAIEVLDEADGNRAAVLFRPPRPSRDRGGETSLEITNRLTSAVRLWWVDRDGERRPYGTIEPGARHHQHTFVGHVFLVEGEAIPQAACIMATEEPVQVLLDDKTTRNIARRPVREKSSGPDATAQAYAACRSPDGVWTAFVRNDDLWLRNRDDQNEHSLATDGEPNQSFRRDTSRARMIDMEYDLPEAPPDQPSVHWAPDSRHLLAWQASHFAKRRVRYIESSPEGQIQPRLRSYPYLKAGDPVPIAKPRIFSIDPPREIPVDGSLFPNPWDLRFLRWSVDGQRVFLLYHERGHQRSRVLELTAESGVVRVVVEETSPTFIHYSAEGKYELHWLPQEQLIWASERSGWNHLYRYDITRGEVLNAVTSGDWNVRRVEHVDDVEGIVWFYAVGIVPGQDPYHEHFCRVRLDGSDLRVLTEGDGTHEIAWSPDRRFFVDRFSRADRPPVHELRSADGKLVCHLESADASEFEAEGGRFPVRFVAKGRDGKTDIWGLIHFPADFRGDLRYPVLEEIYAGPHDHHVPKSFTVRQGARRVADEGFIVVQIDGMGTAWRSKAFHDVCWRNLRDAGFPDRIAWIRAAAKEHPQIDLNRVGIFGGSAGGQNAMAAVLWHHDFYKAAAADCGCHDNRMDKIWWSEQWMGWPVDDHYAANSNTENAHLLGRPLLLTVGEGDQNVDPASTMQVVGRLIRAQKDFEFRLIVGLGHGAGESPWAARQRIEFFRKHLGKPE